MSRASHWWDNVERNDLEQIAEAYRRGTIAGTWGPDDGRVAAMLVDTGYRIAMAAVFASVRAEPEVAAALAARVAPRSP